MPVILSHIVNNCVAINETIAMTEAQTDKERGDNITSMHQTRDIVRQFWGINPSSPNTVKSQYSQYDLGKSDH